MFGVLIFAIYSISAKNKGISELLAQVDRAAETEILVQSIRNLQNDTGEDVGAFNELLLSSDKLIGLIENIEGAGRALGIETKIVSVGEADDDSAPSATAPDEKNEIKQETVQIIIEAEGSWSETLSFLRAMESLPYRIMIEESSMSKGEISWNSRIILSLEVFD